VIVASFSDPFEIAAGNVYLFPKEFQVDGFVRAIRNGDVLMGYKNSLLYAVLGTTVLVIGMNTSWL
jgi:putative aldouronate transport system permease protein